MLPFRGMVFLRPVLLALMTCLGGVGCNRVEEPASDGRPASTLPVAAAPALVPTPEPDSAALIAPRELLSLPSSAYQASLFADDEAIELLTASAAYRVAPGLEPESRALDLGFAATVTRQSYIYWSQGAVWSAARRARKPSGATKLAALSEQPQRFVADIAGDEFAFLTRSADDHYAIAKLHKGRVKTLYTSPGSIDTLTMIGDTLYFVERPKDAGWRIARVDTSGGEATFGAPQSGRWPAQLRGRDEPVYYDGSRRTVLSLSADLQRERVLAKDIICSPFAVAANVYCSTMEGVFELPSEGKPRRIVPVSRKLITNLAANSQQLAFITDAGGQGQDRLTLNVVPLAEPASAPPR